MTLKEAFSEHLVAGQQGQLVIKFIGDVHLCKILVEDGRVLWSHDYRHSGERPDWRTAAATAASSGASRSE